MIFKCRWLEVQGKGGKWPLLLFDTMKHFNLQSVWRCILVGLVDACVGVIHTIIHQSKEVGSKKKHLLQKSPGASEEPPVFCRSFFLLQ